MSNILSLTKSVTTGGKIKLSFGLISGGTLPAEIFIYENTGGTTLGDYQGVCNLEELSKYGIWAGTATPKFGNRYLRYNQGVITLDSILNMDSTILHVKSTVQSLSDSVVIFNQSQTELINIL